LQQWPCKSRLGVEADELQAPELFGDVMLRDRLEDNRQEPLRQFDRPVHLPPAALRLDRFRRDDKYDPVCLRNQAAEACFPGLARLDVVAVEERREAGNFESGQEFVGERGGILTRIGDEDLELLSCTNVGHTLTPERGRMAQVVA